MFIVISGVSSSGKNTVINELIKRRDNLKILERSSGTTRQPRERDKIFNTYVYFTQDEFKAGVEKGLFFEHEEVHGQFYGLILKELEKAIEDKKNYYIRDVDVKGVVNLKKKFADNMLSIFLDAPDEGLRERLKNRGDSPEDIEKRLSRGALERSYKEKYDVAIENIDLDKTVEKILDFIDKVK